MKKKFAIILFTVIMTISSIPVYAAKSTDANKITPISAEADSTVNKSVDREMKKLAKQLGGKSKSIKIGEIPKGVTPLRFKSIKAAKQYLKREEAELRKLEKLNPVIKVSNISSVNLLQADVSGVKQGSCNVNKSVGLYMNIDASYTGNGKKFTGCTGVNSYLTGYTTGNAWTQSSYDANIVSKGKKLKVNVYGSIDHYILIHSKASTFMTTKHSFKSTFVY